MVSEKISLSLARRIALAAQGFNRPRPDGVTRRHLDQTIARLGLLQIDSVNVLTRMHYLPLFSRLGAYPRSLLEEAAWGVRSKRKLFEYWAHEASLLPIGAQPLLRWRMARAERGKGIWNRLKPFAVERRAEAETLLKRIEADGPLAVSDLEHARGSGGWWGWSDAKAALEWLFWSGRITTKTRRANFERVYDLTERVLPEAILASPTPEPREAHRALIAVAARALGVATVKDLRDYFRLSPEDASPCIPELVEDGELIPVQVEDWSQAAFAHVDAVKPRKTTAHALLAPFDPLIWERSRAERLFALRYRIEIYTPAHKREHGYYVLPFLEGDQITARVDLKSDRAASALRVQAAHREPTASAATASHLANELQIMASWLGLSSVEVRPIGTLAEALASALTR
jgi:uncharacterized protein YcaQ